MKWQPHEYQIRAARFLVENQYGGLFLDPGLGKTSTVLAAYKALRRAGFVKRMLVVAPLRVAYLVWPQEVQKWDDFGGFSVGVLHGDRKDEVLRGGHDIHVINYDGLSWLERVGGMSGYEMLVIDESTAVKNGATLRFKILKRNLHRFKRRVILTGTPTPNTIMDLWAQMYLLDRGESLGPYITHFRNQYFSQGGFGGYTYVPLPGAVERIQAIVAHRTLRMSADEYLSLPPLVESNIYVTLPPEARKIYRDLEKDFMAELDDGTVTAVNVAVKLLMLRQCSGGGLYLGNPEKDWQDLHGVKTEAVQEIVEELSGKPAMVVYEFLHELERLREAFPYAPHIGGDVTPRETDAIVAKWNRGEIPVLLVHPRSVGHGLNMQEAGIAVIWHTLTYSYEQYDQLIRRIWRQGQRAEKVFVYHVLAENTVDSAVLGAVQRKKRGQQALFDALVEYRKKVFDKKR